MRKVLALASHPDSASRFNCETRADLSRAFKYITTLLFLFELDALCEQGGLRRRSSVCSRAE